MRDNTLAVIWGLPQGLLIRVLPVLRHSLDAMNILLALAMREIAQIVADILAEPR